MVGDRESNLDVTGPSPVLQDFIDHVKVLHPRGKLNKARKQYFLLY